MDPFASENLVALNGSASAWFGGGASLMLDSILQTAEQLAPGTHVGICVADRTGTYTTLAGTDPLVFVLGEIQYDFDDGPGITAVREEHTVIVDDAESEHRWPRFMSRAVDLGLRSYLGVPIVEAGRTLGGLNMYSTVHASVDTTRLATAKLLATQSAVALGQAQREHNLVLALQSSRTIGKAIGVLMERFDLDDHEAFERLAAWSQRTNVKLRDLAPHLVRQSNDLRQFTEAARPRHQQHWPELTLTPPLDATDDPELDTVDPVPPLTEFIMHSVGLALLSDP